MKKWGSFAILVGFAVMIFMMARSDRSGPTRESLDQPPGISTTSFATQAKPHARSSMPSEVLEQKADTVKHERIRPKALSSTQVGKQREPSSIENYFHDDKVRIEGSSYLVSQSLRVLPVHEFDARDGSPVANISGYVFFESSNLGLGQPALFDERKRSLAILTGRLLLKAQSREQAQGIATKYGAILDTSMSHLNIYALSITSDVLTLQEEVGQGSFAEIIHGVVHEK
tara:strand:- start:8854 stop:9540 length:687 start_codon:yes stop_codon:yes gene_type:complete